MPSESSNGRVLQLSTQVRSDAVALCADLWEKHASIVTNEAVLGGASHSLATVGYSAASLVGGNAGLAVYFAAQRKASYAGAWREFADASLRSAIDSAMQDWPGTGIDSGWTGIAWAADAAFAGSADYATLRRRLETMLGTCYRAALNSWIEEGVVPKGADDYLSGAGGWLAYLQGKGEDAPALGQALTTVLRSQNQRSATSPQSLAVEPGQAHGVAGTLSAMRPWLTDGQAVAKAHMMLRALPATTTDYRWCHGITGIAESLWGLRRLRPEWGPLAVSLATRTAQAITSAEWSNVGICHGLSGPLLLVHRFYQRTGADVFSRAAELGTRQLIGCYDSQRPTGFIDHTPGGTLLESRGLLSGSAGVSLTLASLAGQADTGWQRLLGVET